MAVKIRLANQGDFKTCNALHNAAYDSARSLEQWAWTFNSSLFSEADLHFVLAEDEGKIVGTQALMPIQMIDAGGVYWSAKSEETLVDLEYRGQGLFEKMYEKAFEVARESNFESIWGFTPARKSFERVGFEIPQDTSQLFRPLRSDCITTLLRPSAGDSGSRSMKGFMTALLYTVAGLFASLYSAGRQIGWWRGHCLLRK